MEIDDDMTRFPASIDDALLMPETPELPEAPEVKVRPRSSQTDGRIEPKANAPSDTAPLYFQCPSCRSTLCVPAKRLGNPTAAPCGHCASMIMPPMLIAPEAELKEAPRKTRFSGGSLSSPK